MAHANRYEQAVDGLGDMPYGGGVVRIRDGHTYWLCSETAFDRAAEELRALPPLEGDEGGAEAYGELCRLTCRRSPIAAVAGDSRHGSDVAQHALIAGALYAGIIDADMARAMGATLGQTCECEHPRLTEGGACAECGAECSDAEPQDGGGCGDAECPLHGAPVLRVADVPAPCPGARITAGEGEDRDTGVVRSCSGYLCTVAWESGVVTTQPVTAFARWWQT
jgi:hypothetical protein